MAVIGAVAGFFQASVPLHAQQAAPKRAAAPSAAPAIVDAVVDALQWRSIGPANMGGRITDVEGLPSPSRTFYVAAASGGIWKTTNNGVTFRPLFQHERVISLGDLAIAPSDTLQIWAGTGEEDARNSISPGGGVYKSTDGGLRWRLTGLERTEHIGRIVVHPTNPDIVWVAAVGATWRPNPERGLYKTTDGGVTWRRVKFVNDRAGFVDLVVHPQNPDILFATSWERLRGPYFFTSGGPGSALWKSLDGGETWTEVEGGGFPRTLKGRIGIDIARSHPDVMYALVEAEAPDGEPGGCDAAKAGGCGLYRSADGGRTWRWLRPEHQRPFYFSQIRVDPTDPDRVYWLGMTAKFSTDGGRTARLGMQGLHEDLHALWIDPNDPSRMIVGTDGGIGITFDRGGNYWFPNTFAIGQFYAVSFDLAVPYHVCGGLQDNGTWCGPSRREAGSINNDFWTQISGGDGFVTAQDPREPAIVYWEIQGGKMHRSDLRTGKTIGLAQPNFAARYRLWQDSMALVHSDPTVRPTRAVRARLKAYRRNQVRDSLEAQDRYTWRTPFLLSPHNPDVLYAGANRVLESTARGDYLRPISPDLSKQDTMKIRVSTRATGGITPDAGGAETYGAITALAESPVQHGLLLAGTDDGNVWLRPNDGGTWLDLTPKFRGLVPETTYVSGLEPSPHDANRFYVAFDNHQRGDFRPYVFVTHNGGRTFHSIASNLPTGGPDFVRVVREDLVNPQLLFLGTDVGLYLSFDQGGSWRRVGGEFPTVPVHDLKIHPRDRELIVATHGRSLWIADIALLQQLTPDVTASQVPVLFQSAPALQFNSLPYSVGVSTGHAVFTGDNRPYGAEIIYYIPVGSVRPVPIVITDAQGDTVQMLTGPGGAGLHRVSWNYFYAHVQRPRVLSPAEQRDSLVTMKRADVVADSLIRAGMDAALVRREAARLKGTPLPSSPAPAATGGNGGSSEESGRGGRLRLHRWAERPGEGAVLPLGGPVLPQPLGSQVWEAFQAAGVPGTPGARRFYGRVAAGRYTASVTLGERTYTTRLDIVNQE